MFFETQWGLSPSNTPCSAPIVFPIGLHCERPFMPHDLYFPFHQPSKQKQNSSYQPQTCFTQKPPLWSDDFSIPPLPNDHFWDVEQSWKTCQQNVVLQTPGTLFWDKKHKKLECEVTAWHHRALHQIFTSHRLSWLALNLSTLVAQCLSNHTGQVAFKSEQIKQLRGAHVSFLTCCRMLFGFPEPKISL